MSGIQAARVLEVEAREQSLFDEAYYLSRHPDIAAAVEAGRLKDGWSHYRTFGRKENRDAQLGDFNSAFYSRSYPQAQVDIEGGLALSMLDHFDKLGRARGYLPNLAAERPENPQGFSSRFGGLWFDAGNGLDLIDGKEEAGLLTATQAALLRAFRNDGYVILRNAVPSEVVDRALEALDAIYAGRVEGQLFECAPFFRDFVMRPWQLEINNYASKALDPHFFSAALRDLIFARGVSEFLNIAFESSALASQSLGFLRGSAQAGHQDSAYVNYSRPRNFVASWIALEDVTPGAGELFYYVGSHRFDDFLYNGKYKTHHDAKRMNGNVPFPGEGARLLASLERRVEEQKIERQTFIAKKGDVLIWHADLMHGGSKVSQEVTRKSLVTHYCPSRLAPLYFESRKARIFKHERHYFSSGVYHGVLARD